MEITESLEGKQVSPRSRTSKSWISRALASGLGLGYIPVAPGTWGAVGAVFLVAGLYTYTPAATAFGIHLLLTIGLFFLAWLVGSHVTRMDQESDPSFVVIDEILGQSLCFLFVSVSTFSLVAGFVLFRVLDVSKPFPARQSERLPGGLGIAMDDVIAGVYAGLLLWMIQFLMA